MLCAVLIRRRSRILPFDRYVSLPERGFGTTFGFHGEPDTRIILHGLDRDDPYTSMATVKFGAHRIELNVYDIGFGSLSAHRKTVATSLPNKDFLNVHMIVHPGSPCSSGIIASVRMSPMR